MSAVSAAKIVVLLFSPSLLFPTSSVHPSLISVIYFAFLLFLSADFLNNPHPLFEAVQSQLTSSKHSLSYRRESYNQSQIQLQYQRS